MESGIERVKMNTGIGRMESEVDWGNIDLEKGRGTEEPKLEISYLETSTGRKKSGRRSRKKRPLTGFLLGLILLTGICIFAYPTFSNWWNSFHQSQVIEGYREKVAGLKESEILKRWREAQKYNAKLRHKPDRFHLSSQEKKEYKHLLAAGDSGIMGYIEIGKIQVSLPVYHGTRDETLQIAVGHIEGSSLPVGGSGTHAVLSGHRGLPSAKLFSDIDRLEIGDQFVLHVLGRRLTYEVDQITTVLPKNVKELEIIEGKDYVTLVTCTPYGVNTHRLLVRGRRTATRKDDVTKNDKGRWKKAVFIVLRILIVCLLLYLLLGVILPAFRREAIRRERKKRIFVLLLVMPLLLLMLFVLQTHSFAKEIPTREQKNAVRSQKQEQQIPKQPLSLKIHLSAGDENFVRESIAQAGVVVDIYQIADARSVFGNVIRFDSVMARGYGEMIPGKETGGPEAGKVSAGKETGTESDATDTDVKAVHPDTSNDLMEWSIETMSREQWERFAQKAADISLGLSGKEALSPLIKGAKPDERISGLTPGLYLLAARGTARGATIGTARGTTTGTARGTTTGTARGTTIGTARGTTTGTARGTTTGTARGTARGTTRGATIGTARATTRGATIGTARGTTRETARGTTTGIDSRTATDTAAASGINYENTNDTILLTVKTDMHELTFKPELVVLLPKGLLAGEVDGVAQDPGDGAEIWVKVSMKPVDPVPDGTGNPSGPGNPNAPGNPGGSDNPNGPGNPGGSDNPNGPGNPGGSDNPNAPGNPDNADTPGGPGKTADDTKTPESSSENPATPVEDYSYPGGQTPSSSGSSDSSYDKGGGSSYDDTGSSSLFGGGFNLKTGDVSPVLFYGITALISVLLFVIFGGIFFKQSRRNRGKKGG